MKVPHPLNTKERYMFAIVEKLDRIIELLDVKEAPAKPARKATKKKEV